MARGMTALRRLSWPIVWLLLAAALLVRLALPAGWMPVVAADGIRIELCSGSGPMYAVLAADGSIHPEGPAAKHDPCPFGLAGATPFDLPPPPLVLPLPPAALTALLQPALIAARLTAWRSTRPPARGPPVLA